MKIIDLILLILFFQMQIFAETPNNIPVDSIKNNSGNISSLPTSSSADSTTEKTMLTDSSNTQKSSVKLNKRNYNHKDQVIFAAGMMAFIAIIFASVQNWNPD